MTTHAGQEKGKEVWFGARYAVNRFRHICTQQASAWGIHKQQSLVSRLMLSSLQINASVWGGGGVRVPNTVAYAIPLSFEVGQNKNCVPLFTM